MGFISGLWNSVPFSAFAAICGSFVGATGSAVSVWIAQKHQDRRDLLGRKISQREQLYSDFITESASAIADATQHKFEDPNRLIPTYALLSRIRLSSSTIVVDSAERVVQTILSTYSAPNLTPEELYAYATKHNDPLREFSEICRRDLETLWKDV